MMMYSCNNFNFYFLEHSNDREREHLEEMLKSNNNCLVTYGEWEGPIVLPWLYYKKGHAIIFEPNPLAFSRLHNNLKFYSNYSLYNMCINKNGDSTFITTTGGATDVINEKEGFLVNCISYNELIKRTSECLHKIDIEGYEENLISDIIKISPIELTLSIHMPNIKNKNLFNSNLEKLKQNYKDVIIMDERKDGIFDFYEIYFKNRK